MNEILRYFSDSFEPLYIDLCGVTLKDSKYRIDRPYSALTVLEYVYSGEGYIEKDGKPVPVGADTVYLLCAGHDHRYGSDPDNPWEKIFINISGKLAAQLPAEFGLEPLGIYSGEGMYDLFSRVRAIAEGNPQENDEAALVAIFTEALFRLSQKRIRSKHSDEALKMKQLLDSSTGRIVSNEELSRCIFRSKDYCIKRFAAEFGVTPYEYQLSVKIEAACSLLRTTALPIATIAAAVGYNDPQYFSGLFRKRVGMPPREYRRQQGG